MTATNTDTFSTDVEGVDSENSATKETAKTLVIIAATTAVMIGAPKVVRLARDKFIESRTARLLQKDAQKVHVVTDLPETETA